MNESLPTTASAKPKCYEVAFPCKFDQNKNLLRNDEDLTNSVCEDPLVQLVIRDGVRCCDLDNVLGGNTPYVDPKPEPFPVPVLLNVCVIDKSRKVVESSANKCPESSECPPNTWILLGGNGKCCCTSEKLGTVSFP